MKKRKEEKANDEKEILARRRKLGVGFLKPDNVTRNQPTMKDMVGRKRGRPLITVLDEDLSALRKEMKAYESLCDERLGVDMLLWWKNHSDMFHCYLSSPGLCLLSPLLVQRVKGSQP